jgi:hypothetical protein
LSLSFEPNPNPKLNPNTKKINIKIQSFEPNPNPKLIETKKNNDQNPEL